MNEKKIDIDFNECASLALEATEEILVWVSFANESISEELKTVFAEKGHVHPWFLSHTPSIYLPTALFCLVSTSKDYKWKKNALSIPDNFFWTMIALYHPKEKKWQLEVGWGKFYEVKKISGKFGSLDIARELLEGVNEQRKESGEVKGSHSIGKYEVFGGWDPFLKNYNSREAIGELAMTICKTFQDEINKITK